MPFHLLFLPTFRYFSKRRNRRFLTNRQYHELKDARLVLGTIALFYLANVLPFYISFCHILKLHPSYEAAKLSHFGLVINSSLKFIIYIAFSRRLRRGFLALFEKDISSSENGLPNDDELVTLKPRKMTNVSKGAQPENVK